MRVIHHKQVLTNYLCLILISAQLSQHFYIY